ncbi:MAG: tetratricopeptide repeat protein, partial [Stellaceae bacterium]
MSKLDTPVQTQFGEPRVSSAPEIAAGNIRGLRSIGASPNSPCFIHSSWRTGKTWFSLLFRHFPETICFYEPFNETLATLTAADAVQLGPQSWESAHPSSISYWREYIGLIRNAGGVRLFRPEMSYDWFIPIGGLRGALRPGELKYLAFLIRYAQRRRQIPVLAFSRSLGRIHPIVENFRGTHLVIIRNLYAQWASYSYQRQIGNPYFVRSVFAAIDNCDPFFEHLRDFYLGAIPPAGDGNSMLAASTSAQRTDQILALLSDGDIFTIFVAMHIYFYMQARSAADLMIDSTKLARDHSYRQSVTHDLREMTGLQLSVADAKESFHFTTANHGVINRNHLERHVRVAANMLEEAQENTGSLRFAEELFEGLYAEISKNSYLEPARQQFSALATEKAALQATIGDRDAAVAAAEAKAGAAEAGAAGARAELAALRVQIAELERERDERAAALARLEAETVDLRSRMGDRDAAVVAAEARAGAAEASLAEVRDELAALRGQVADLERDGRERVAALAQVEAEAAGLRVRLGELAAVTATTAGRASAAEASFAKARTEITQLRDAIDRADADIRQRGAAEFTLRGEIESMRRALNRTEQQRSERAEEVAALRVEVAAHGAAAAAAQGQVRGIEARLAEAQQEIEARRAQLARAAEETAEHASVVGTLKTEIVALRAESSATAQVGHELIAASTADVVAPDKRNQSGHRRAAMLRLAGPTRARAVARGDQAREAKQWPLAARHYRQALDRDPLDAPCWVQYGHALKEFGSLPEAEAAYRRSLALAPSLADTHLQLGHVLKLQGRAQAAQAAYLRAFALDPQMPASSEELAGLGWSPAHLTQMRGLLAKPEIAQLRSLRDAADAARDRRDWPQAAKLYQEVVAADPSALDIAVQLGHAFKEAGDLDRAAQAYDRVLEARPRDDDLHLQIGHLEKLRGDYAAAAAHYQRAAELNPANAQARRESEAVRSRVAELRRWEDANTEPAPRQADRAQNSASCSIANPAKRLSANLPGRSSQKKIYFVVQGLFLKSDSIGYDCVFQY